MIIFLEKEEEGSRQKEETGFELFGRRIGRRGQEKEEKVGSEEEEQEGIELRLFQLGKRRRRQKKQKG